MVVEHGPAISIMSLTRSIRFSLTGRSRLGFLLLLLLHPHRLLLLLRLPFISVGDVPY